MAAATEHLRKAHSPIRPLQCSGAVKANQVHTCGCPGGGCGRGRELGQGWRSHTPLHAGDVAVRASTLPSRGGSPSVSTGTCAARPAPATSGQPRTWQSSLYHAVELTTRSVNETQTSGPMQRASRLRPCHSLSANPIVVLQAAQEPVASSCRCKPAPGGPIDPRPPCVERPRLKPREHMLAAGWSRSQQAPKEFEDVHANGLCAWVPSGRRGTRRILDQFRDYLHHPTSPFNSSRKDRSNVV